jgi:hypothetical protein
MSSGGKVTGSRAALTGAADEFSKHATAIARLVEQITAAQHVDTGDGSLNGLVGGLVSEIVASMGGFGEHGVQAGATALAQQATNFQHVGHAPSRGVTGRGRELRRR